MIVAELLVRTVALVALSQSLAFTGGFGAGMAHLRARLFEGDALSADVGLTMFSARVELGIRGRVSDSLHIRFCPLVITAMAGVGGRGTLAAVLGVDWAP